MIHHPGGGPVVKKVIVQMGKIPNLIQIPSLVTDGSDQFLHGVGDGARSCLFKIEIESPVLPDIPVLIKSIEKNGTVQQGILHRDGGVIRNQDIRHTQEFTNVDISGHIDDIIRDLSLMDLGMQTDHEAVILTQFVPESLKIKMIQEMVIPLLIIPEGRGIKNPFLSPHLGILPA